jgi:hypothetical protein
MNLFKRIVNRLTHPVGINPFPRSFPRGLEFSAEEASEVFDRIFTENYWGSNSTRSGVGSEERYAAPYRARLKALLEREAFESIFDAPCGDLSWIVSMILTTKLGYIGGDISRAAISSSCMRYPELDLRVFDITTDRFPQVDLWHCRDCLFHLPFSLIYQALDNFLVSSIPFALITSHRSLLLHSNLDVDLGGFRFLDLERAPFSFPPPLRRIADYRLGIDFPRYMCLWSRQQLSNVLKER